MYFLSIWHLSEDTLHLNLGKTSQKLAFFPMLALQKPLSTSEIFYSMLSSV